MVYRAHNDFNAKDTKLLNDIKARISLSQKFKIVFYGDSSVSTEWVHPNWRDIIEYVVKMELENFEEHENGMSQWNYSWWNLNFINSGINGGESKDFVERLERDVFSYSPDMVIFLGGGNDVDKIRETEAAQNYHLMLKLLANKVKYVYFATDIRCANIYHNKRYEKYIDQQKTLFPYKEASFINLYDASKDLPLDKFFTYKIEKAEEEFLTDHNWKGGKVDTFHPNRLGNAYIAQYLLREIFNLDFDPELYISDVIADNKYPRY